MRGLRIRPESLTVVAAAMKAATMAEVSVVAMAAPWVAAQVTVERAAVLQAKEAKAEAKEQEGAAAAAKLAE